MAFFVLYSTRKNWKVTPVTFALTSIAVAVFQFSHLLGTNSVDPEVSRSFLMYNLTDIWIGIFMCHWFLGFLGKNREQHMALSAVYISGITIFLACLLFPSLFLIDSVPKLYFPNYYEPGPLYYVMYIWFLIVTAYSFYQLIQGYRKETNPILKKRNKFILVAMVYAYIFGTTAFLLVFDIPFNPLLSSLFGLYPLLIAYTILEYEAFDIKIFAKGAFVYGVSIFAIGFIIAISNYLGNFFLGYKPDLPTWIAPALVSLLLGTGSMYIYKKARDADTAKYEFITIVTHKFRTPLTRIRWSAEELRDTVPENKKSSIDAIFQSEIQLLELTNALVQLLDFKTHGFKNKMESIHLSEFFQKLESEYQNRAEQKGLRITFEIPEHIEVLTDIEKLRVVLQIILDNAISYTPKGGSISVASSLDEKTRQAVIEIKDTGIGISSETLGQIFSSFYRGAKARLADTEGMGIGLSLAKNILKKQGGKIWLKSEGEGKGSTFYVQLKALPRKV
ncbi:MAG: ATP-binding protein [bacterium]|nr:ATP-binding protein [bacterium]